MTQRLFWDDPYLLEFDATVVARRRHQERPAVVLDRTAFYAESGGQPWDIGTLSGVPVVAVVEEGGEILHVLDGELAGDAVHGEVDGARRLDHVQQHHGQHLFSRALVEVAAARTVSFHLGSEDVTIDLDRLVSEQQIRTERRAGRSGKHGGVGEGRAEAGGGNPAARRSALRRGRARRPGPEPLARALEEAGARPPHRARLRPQTCSGTHPRNTAEWASCWCSATSATRARGCASRAAPGPRDRPDGCACSTSGRRFLRRSRPARRRAPALDQLKESERRGQDLLERALEGEARRLLAEAEGTPAIVVRAYDGWPPADLRVLANHLIALAPCVALLGSRTDKAHLVFARSEGLPHDVGALLKDALALVGGRGGGRGNVAQGGGDRVDRLDEALAQAALAARPRPG